MERYRYVAGNQISASNPSRHGDGCLDLLQFHILQLHGLCLYRMHRSGRTLQCPVRRHIVQLAVPVTNSFTNQSQRPCEMPQSPFDQYSLLQVAHACGHMSQP